VCEWARQQTGEPEEQPIKLSEYEDALKETKIEDFSETALKRYRTKAAIKPAVSSAEFNRLLKSQGLVAEGGQSPSGFGYLLFGKDPRLAMPQAGLLARAEFPNEKPRRSDPTHHDGADAFLQGADEESQSGASFRVRTHGADGRAGLGLTSLKEQTEKHELPLPTHRDGGWFVGIEDLPEPDCCPQGIGRQGARWVGRGRAQSPADSEETTGSRSDPTSGTRPFNRLHFGSVMNGNPDKNPDIVSG